MEHERKRKLALFAGAIVVAIMFLTSYAAFGSNGTAQSTTTSIKQSTYPVFGNANAVVIGYGSSVSVTLIDINASGALNSTLSKLEANSTITNFIPTATGFIVYAPGSAPYTVQEAFGSALPHNAIALNGTESIRIPSSLVLYYYGTETNVHTNTTNFTIPVQELKPTGSNVSVSIRALVLPDGNVYQNNIQVS